MIPLIANFVKESARKELSKSLGKTASEDSIRREVKSQIAILIEDLKKHREDIVSDLKVEFINQPTATETGLG